MSALTEQQLDEIRARLEHAREIAGSADWPLPQYEAVRASLADEAALLADNDRLRASADGAWRRIDDTLTYLANQDTTDWPAEALGLGLDIVAHLDAAPRADEVVPAAPTLPWTAFLTDVEQSNLVSELASVFLDYWRGDRPDDAATLRDVEQLLVKHRDGSQAAEYRFRAAAQAEAAELTVFRAEHPDGGITLGHYATAEAARAHCEAFMRRERPDAALDWIEDEEDGVAELVAEFDGRETTTGYLVTALAVPAAFDADGDE